MFHLAWFTNPMPNTWQGGSPWAGNDHLPEYWQTGDFYVDMARSLDRAGFDYLMFEDHVTLTSLDSPMPRLDPVTLITRLTDATKNLGVVATVSTAFEHPFAVARRFTSLDHLTRGRVGWNVVTTSEESAAHAFGLEAMPAHDERYERADEFLELATNLWDNGWDRDAVIMDRARGLYSDPARVHQVSHDGRYFKSSGSLNNSASPQGRPTISQAGTSGKGMALAARWADTVLVSTSSNDPQKMKDVRDAVRAEAVSLGRDPDEINVMFWIEPTLAESDDIAREVHRIRTNPTQARIKDVLDMFTKFTELDMYSFDLDSPLPEVDVDSLNGHRATFGGFYALRDGGRRTLREMIGAYSLASVELIGTPSTVADRMEEAMEIVGGDGFLIRAYPLTRRYVAEITDGLVPELQRRGLVRTRYTGSTLRENLRAF